MFAWKNSRYFATSPLASQSSRNDVLETTAEIPYWWRVTTQIWVELPIGWSKFPTRSDQSDATPNNYYKNVFVICFCNLCWTWKNRNVAYIYSHIMCEEKRQTDKGLRTVKELPPQTAAPFFFSWLFADYQNQSPLLNMVCHLITNSNYKSGK